MYIEPTENCVLLLKGVKRGCGFLSAFLLCNVLMRMVVRSVRFPQQAKPHSPLHSSTLFKSKFTYCWATSNSAFFNTQSTFRISKQLNCSLPYTHYTFVLILKLIRL